MHFFLHLEPPRTTAQEHKVTVRNGKPYFYDPPAVARAKALLTANLADIDDVAGIKIHTAGTVRAWCPLGGQVVFPAWEAQGWRIQRNEAGYRQPSEDAQGLHDTAPLLEG